MLAPAERAEIVVDFSSGLATRLLSEEDYNSPMGGGMMSQMMGGGFGGCTINIIKKDAVQAFTEQATAAYRNMFGRDCSVHEVTLSEGTHLLATT